ncbi:glycoside hydrolase family 19 protein [Chryseobacterium sp. GP-SGM7]|uniref:glycoside hydrolase family 19 protein n=1 Tax=Chryseobacterium sp. GP-SGM7 TaxID=3411323 RepID=UPI003B9360E1
MKADNKQKMEEKRAENEEKDKAEEGLLLAIDGARIKFNAHLGKFKVLNNVPTTQDKLTGTVVEKQIPNFIFDDGFQMISLTEWQDFGTAKVQENYVLLKKSTLPGTGKMPGNIPPESGKIEFVTSGQVNVPEKIDPKGAPVPEQEKKQSPCSDDFTLAQIKKVWPNASNLVWMQGIVDELNKSYTVNGESKKLYEIFELNTCLNRSHFFAQAFVESGDNLSGAFNGESLNYSVEALRSGYPFSVFKNNKKYYDYADEIGRKSEIDPKTKKKKLVHAADQEQIANIAYDDDNRGKDYKLGNIKEGDGWKFRGRGLMQITGRSNYKSIQEIIDTRLPESGTDLSSGKSVFTAKEAVFAGLGDWILKKANTLAKNGATHDVVNSITAKINYSTKSYSDRRDAFDRTVKIFKDDDK